MSPLAERIRDYISENRDDPDKITIPAIAKGVGDEAVVVGFVLDSFFADANGEVRYVGTGAGGGWIPEEEPTEEDILNRQLKDNVITQEDYDLRMELVKRGKDPRDAAALHELIIEKQNQADKEGPLGG